MSDRVLKEKSKNSHNEFTELSEIQESEEFRDLRISELGNIVKIVDTSNETIHNEISATDMSNRLSAVFGGTIKGNFESYRRAGKFFFRFEHNEGKEYSKLMSNLFKVIMEKNMKKRDVHYIITPNSASAVFR